MRWSDAIGSAQTDAGIASGAATARLRTGLHMALIVAGAFAAAVATTIALHAMGVLWFAQRWGAAALVGYGAFFSGVRIWLWYALRGVSIPKASPGRRAPFYGVGFERKRPEENASPPLYAAGEEPLIVDPPEVLNHDWYEGVPVSPRTAKTYLVVYFTVLLGSVVTAFFLGPEQAGLNPWISPDTGNCNGLAFVMILVGLAVAEVGSSFAAIRRARELLREVAYQALIVRALGRRSGAPGAFGWPAVVFRATWVAAAAFLVVATVAGHVLDELFPWADTLLDLLRRT